jgi:cystathionine gamma-synthase
MSGADDCGRPEADRPDRECRPDGGTGTPAVSLATRAVHAGLDPDPSYGSVVPPIHQTSTYVQRGVGEFVEDYDYARSANPTRAALERALGALEGGVATAFASGMAATHALITCVCEAGAHVVLPADLYGGTYRLVDKVLARWGLRYTMVDQTDLDALAAAVCDDTKLIWVETPTNPLLNVVDVAGVVERRRGALVAVDNTFATPVNQRPLELGADFAVHSTTKYLGGHSDTVGGAVVARDPAWDEQLRFVQNAVGAVPGPLDCFLVHRGLRTLALRMRAHAESARAVVALLRAEGVEDVRWPGFSGMVSFRHPAAVAIAQATRLFALAESLGGVESLVEVPQAMTHQSVEDSTAAVPADLVRLSCGIEAPEDLVGDLRQALGAATAGAAAGDAQRSAAGQAIL